jgi:hypothetical protein
MDLSRHGGGQRPEAEQEMQDRSARLINVLHPKKQTSEQRQIFEHMFEATEICINTFGIIMMYLLDPKAPASVQK